MKKIAEDLGKFFIDRDLSQKEVALAMGVSTSYINAILNSRNII